jgi:hypothetical protein
MGYGVTARDGGLAMRARLGSTCPHPNDQAEPVTLSTGEVVAMLCGVCLIELPKSWGCQDCEWEEIRRMCDPGEGIGQVMNAGLIA